MAGVRAVLAVLLDLLINGLGGDIIVGAQDWWRQELSLSLALLIVGVPLWIYYWGRVLKLVDRDTAERRTRSRRVFLYVVLGVSVIALAAGLVTLISRLLNVALQGSSADWLRDISYSLPAVLVAVPLLLYFWNVLRADQRAGAEAVVTGRAVTLMAPGDAAALAARLSDRLGYKVKALRYKGDEPAQLALDDAGLEQLALQIEQAAGLKIMVLMTGDKISILPYEE